MASDETNIQQPVKTAGKEIREFLEAFPNKAFFSVVALGWLALFYFYGNSTFGYVSTNSLFRWLHGVYQSSDDDAHGYLIPFVVVGLLWWRRNDIIGLKKDVCWPALLLVILGCAMHVLGYMVQQPRISLVAFVLGLYGITGLFWGGAWMRQAFIPFFMFVFCVPVSAISESLTVPLRLLATKITAWVAQHILGIGVLQVGNRLLEPEGRYSYEVAAACSGIRSLTAMLAITTVFGLVQFNRSWKRLMMMLLAVPLAIVANVVRLLMIVVAAEIFGQRGGYYVHDSEWLSLIPYVPAMVVVFLIGNWMRDKTTKEDRPA
ncbi:MAG: exosortase/archaeosortase family protein [Verrucomicrobiota bacterium]